MTTRLIKAGAVAKTGGTVMFPGGNPIKPPLNFTAIPNPDGSDVALSWDENPANAPETATAFYIERDDISGTISRAAGTYTWDDSRDLTAGETITWSIYLTTASGTSNKVYSTATIPGVVIGGVYFRPQRLAGDGVYADFVPNG